MTHSRGRRPPYPLPLRPLLVSTSVVRLRLVVVLVTWHLLVSLHTVSATNGVIQCHFFSVKLFVAKFLKLFKLQNSRKLWNNNFSAAKISCAVVSLVISNRETAFILMSTSFSFSFDRWWRKKFAVLGIVHRTICDVKKREAQTLGQIALWFADLCVLHSCF